MLSFSSFSQSSFAFSSANATTSENPEEEDPETSVFSDQTISRTEEFKDKIAEASGEENDEVVFKARARVHAWKKFSRPKHAAALAPSDNAEEANGESSSSSSATPASVVGSVSGDNREMEEVEDWKECGVGELHVNKYKIKGVSGARLVMRAEKTKRLVLNSPLTSVTHPVVQGEKSLTIILLDQDNKLTKFAIQLKTKSELTAALESMNKLIRELCVQP